MREYTPDTITDVVIEQMATTPDPRMKEIMEAAVRHLHAFAREVNLTPGEWIKGIEFMTKVGQMCTPARQEFILLSDTMGLSFPSDRRSKRVVASSRNHSGWRSRSFAISVRTSLRRALSF